VICRMNGVEISYQCVQVILVGLQELENGLHFGDPALFTLQIRSGFQMCRKESKRPSFPEDLNL